MPTRGTNLLMLARDGDCRVLLRGFRAPPHADLPIRPQHQNPPSRLLGVRHGRNRLGPLLVNQVMRRPVDQKVNTRTKITLIRHPVLTVAQQRRREWMMVRMQWIALFPALLLGFNVVAPEPT